MKVFNEIIGYFRHRLAYTALANQLEGFSDRELADIGILRAEINERALKATRHVRDLRTGETETAIDVTVAVRI